MTSPITAPMPLRAYVSASSRGLALDIARELASRGAQIALSSRNAEHLEAARSTVAVEAPRARILTVTGDLSRQEDQERILDTLEAEDFRPNVFVCSCGQPAPSRLASVERSQWMQDVEMILGQAVFAAKRFAPAMAEAGFGRFIFISSVYAKTPSAEAITSSIARAGLLALSKAIVTDYAQYGIASFPLCLGFVDTPLLRNMAVGRDYDAPEPPTKCWTNKYDDWAADIPAKRIASMREVSELVRFLVSPAASYMNGTVLDFSGGLDRCLV
jgi:3-oxoacyl-[acyl-carrier protein] reductase